MLKIFKKIKEHIKDIINAEMVIRERNSLRIKLKEAELARINDKEEIIKTQKIVMAKNDKSGDIFHLVKVMKADQEKLINDIKELKSILKIKEIMEEEKRD